MNIPESLFAKILGGKCILFLGAGATLSSGGTLGSGLGKSIFRSIGDTGVPYQENLAKYTQLLVNKGYRKEMEKCIRDRFKNLKPTNEFAHIAQVPWKAIYTTNYDDLVEQSFKKQHFYNCVVNTSQRQEEEYGAVDVPLYKINGDINTPYKEQYPLIITLNDLRDTKKTRKKILKQLMKDMNDTFIFIGYSFKDSNEIVTKILDDLSEDDRWESVKEKYVILPEISNDIKLVLDEYRIRYIEGTGDEFFELVSKKAEQDFRIKLNILGKSFAEKSDFKGLDPSIQQYLLDCFDLYNDEAEYPVDAGFFYKGGNPSWGIVRRKYDISRSVDIKYNMEAKEEKINTDVLASVLWEKIDRRVPQKVLLHGTAASGKTTTLYRMAIDFTDMGLNALVYKQQAKYKRGLLTTIYEKSNKNLIVLCDNYFVDVAEINIMINEAYANNIPIMFIIVSRNSDWYNVVSAYNRSVLEPFDITVEMKDSFEKNEAEEFANKLIETGVIKVQTEYEKRGIIRKLQRDNNIITVLFELINGNQMVDSIIDEYSRLTEETKMVYAITSLVYQLGFKIRWEVLQRTINRKYNFSWEQFIETILKRDAEGNIFDEEVQGNYYLLGRNRLICSYIVKIHYDGSYSKEVEAYKEIIESCQGIDGDERFAGGLINSIIKSQDIEYDDSYIIDLLNFAIDSLEIDVNKAYITHLKGEYYIQKREYTEAISCFEANVLNGLNLEYSLHSLGKTYYYMAQSELEKREKFRVHIDMAIDRLIEGTNKYPLNEFYYGLLATIFTYLESVDRMSEKNKKSQVSLERLAYKNIGGDRYKEIVNEHIYSMD